MKYLHFDTTQKVTLDIKDKKILELLNEDCRISLTKISRKTGIPIDTVRYRIERMEKEGIFRYAIVMDPVKIGYPIYEALYINLINFTNQEEKKLMQYTKTHKNFAYSGKALGKYDFIVGIVARDSHELQKIIQEFKTHFQHIIKEFDSLSMLEEYKYDYLLDLIE
jgi:DNA-binding Lrp family transcriptional regulator